MRISADISIYRPGEQNPVQTVPITAASRRTWKLMEEDKITLSFSLAISVDFKIGDYIDDPIFGHFVISEEPMPADYDPAIGAYKYTLQFNADWVCWKNYIFMLTYNGVRTETTWVLTDTIANHLSVLLQNLTEIGYTGYSVDVEGVEDKSRAVCLTYSGTSILDALKALAEAFECEFWVADKVIHFGKCETGTMIDLSMTDENGRVINVENMVPMRNDSEYGNRFFAYGSTKNLPETYRKHLEFNVTAVNGKRFKDAGRPISKDMLNPRVVTTPLPEESDVPLDWTLHSYNLSGATVRSQKIKVLPGCKLWVLTGDVVECILYCQQGDTELRIPFPSSSQWTGWTIIEGVETVFLECKVVEAIDWDSLPQLHYENLKEYGYYATMTWRLNGAVRTNYVKLVDGYFVVVDAIPESTPGSYEDLPLGFSGGTNFTLSEGGTDGLVVTKVPSSYYTDDGDVPQNYRTLGERRLMLPISPFTGLDSEVVDDIQNGYVQRNELSRDEVVERVVFFDEIYPRCALRVTHIDVSEYANDTTYSDGSVKIASLPAYTLQAELVTRNGDVDFPFDPVTMMVVGKLTATFLTPDEAKKYSGLTEENACTLMGMTFDVACNRANGITTYQLAWNSDYGDKLPNSILRPQEGDCFILAGWNPAAMAPLGLIQAAENELANTADEYARLLEEAQFRFECTMMSDWMLARMGTISAAESYKKLILPGQRVVVYHGALSSPKETRVIGFEYKLDIPYDSPIITVGESDAYSRLREIEKSLHAQSSTASASNGVTSSQASAGGAASGGGAETLHLVPGTMIGMSSVDYNGKEEKTFRVPSSIDHLVDSELVPRIAENSQGDLVLVDKEGNEVSGKQFFEEKVDPLDSTKKYIQLKEEYTGLLSPFWMAAGGIGRGGGGGGLIDGVYRATDLGSIYSQGGTDDITKTFSAFAIDKIWQAVLDLQQSTPNVSLVNGQTNSTITVNGVIADFYTKSQVDAIVGAVYRPAGNAASVSALGALTAANIGKVYNMTAEFTTTADFLEGAGKTFPAGTNVVIVDAGSGTYKYDVLSGFVDLSGYAQKVVGATNGNFAGLDASGNLTDSGNKAEDFFTASGEVIIGTQSAATGEWTGASRLATASDFKSGYRFTYWLPYAGSGNATLTLTFKDGTTKAINLYYKGSSRLTTHIGAGNKIDFLYLENANVNGTQYTGAWIDPGYQDGNSYDRILSNYERRYIYSAQTPLYRYKLCGYNNGKLVPLVITDQANATIVDKVPVNVGIDPRMGLVYYSSTTAITSASTVSSNVIYNEIPTTAPPYTFNESIPVYRDVYLKGTIKSDGLFYLDTTSVKTWYVFAPNRPSDGEYLSVFEAGCYYMFVGPTYSTANYLQLKYNNPVFYFDGSRLVPIEELRDVIIADEEFLVRRSPERNGKTSYTAKELRGKSLVWNQNVQNGNFADGITGWHGSGSTVTITDGVVDVVSDTESTTSQARLVSASRSFVASHNYLFVAIVKSVIGKISVFPTGTSSDGASGYRVVSSSAFEKFCYIWKAQSSFNSVGTHIRAYTDGVNGIAEFNIRSFACFDLTLMFGAGNEPATVDEFEAMFPLPYYDYNAGEIISNKTEEVKVTGFNQWDEEWESGAYNLTTGEKKSLSGDFRCKNLIKVIPATSYRFTNLGNSGTASQAIAIFYDDAKNIITNVDGQLNYLTVNNQVFKTPANAGYMAFYTVGTTYNNTICINLSDPSRNGEYEPYKEATMNVGIPQMTANNVAIFPDGMKSAGSVYDYAKVDADGYIRKVVKRIGSVDLGTRTWTYYTNQPCFFANKIDDLKSSGDALCGKYATNKKSASQSFDKELSTQPYFDRGIVFVKDTSYGTDATSFATAMDGVILDYELATPVEYTLDTPIFVGKNGANAYYEGGVQSIIPEHTSTPTSAPFRAVLQYGISVEEVNRKLDLYLPLAGGTITGNLAVNGTLTVGGVASFGSTLSVADAISLVGTTAAKRRIYFGDSTHFLELNEYGFHFSHGVYSDGPNGFVAAGGIGTGGGGGSATELGDLVDVSIANRSNGDLLVYNSATSHWENKPQSSIIPTVSVSFNDLTSHPTTIAGYGITDAYTKTQVDSDFALKVGGSGYNFRVQSLILPDGSISSVAASFSSPTPRPTWSFIDNISSLTPTTVTKNIAFVDDIPTALKNPKALTFGSKTYDGSVAMEILASDLGALTAHQTVTLASGTDNGTLKLTTAAGTVDNIAVKGLGSLAYKSSLAASDIPDISGTYVTLAGVQTITGAKTFSADLTLAENLVMGAAKHIDIGPARIEYDAINGALHVTTNQTGNNAPAIGFYADGSNAAGGVGSNGGGGGFGVERITSNQDGTVDFHFTGGDITTVDLNHEHPQYSSKAAEASNPSGGFLPDVVYELGTLTGSVTFALAAVVSGNVNHYFWTFTAGSTAPTITWPTGITWADGTGPTVAANKKYEISVLNGVAAFMEV